MAKRAVGTRDVADWYRGPAGAAARQIGRADKQLTSRLWGKARFKGSRGVVGTAVSIGETR